MPGMSKRYGEDREVSGHGIDPARSIRRLVFDLAKTLANSSACSKSSPAIATGRGQQLDAAIGARLPIPLRFAIAPVSAFDPKRTCRKTESMSLLGVKRTSAGAVHMSAFDPKRTSERRQAAQIRDRRPRSFASGETRGGRGLGR